MRERLAIQTNTPVAILVTSLTSVGAVATATTFIPHGFSTNDYVTVGGAIQASYNVRAQITVTGAKTFTFAVTGSPVSPATGTISATYASDAQGGRKDQWTDVATVNAEMLPIRAAERLQLAAIEAQVDFRFRARRRSDIAETMRALWTSTWPPGSPQLTLTITGILLDDLQYMFIECTKASA